MSGYTKLWSSIIASTVWQAPDYVRIIWISMLAMSDKRGYVYGSIPGLAHAASEPLDLTILALEHLSSPDQYSRNKEHEGRRIEEIPGGWFIFNYADYRAMVSEEDRRAQDAARQAKRRERLKAEAAVTDPVTQSHDDLGLSHQSHTLPYGVGVVDSFSSLPKGKESTSSPINNPVTESHAPSRSTPYTPASFLATWAEIVRSADRADLIPSTPPDTLATWLQNPVNQEALPDALTHLTTPAGIKTLKGDGFTLDWFQNNVSTLAAMYKKRPATSTRSPQPAPPPPSHPATPSRAACDSPAASVPPEVEAVWREILATPGLPAGKIKPRSDRPRYLQVVADVPPDVLLKRWRARVATWLNTPDRENRYAPSWAKWIDDEGHSVPCAEETAAPKKCARKLTAEEEAEIDEILGAQS